MYVNLETRLKYTQRHTYTHTHIYIFKSAIPMRHVGELSIIVGFKKYLKKHGIFKKHELK